VSKNAAGSRVTFPRGNVGMASFGWSIHLVVIAGVLGLSTPTSAELS
jgi:hypothetical protein